MKLNNIILGTAQFGSRYGIGPGNKELSVYQVADIIEMFGKNGGTCIDTAVSYGNCEDVLGEIGLAEFQVINKLPFELFLNGAEVNLMRIIERSLKKLDKEFFDCLLVHDFKNADVLLRDQIFTNIQKLKTSRMVKQVGISIYDSKSLVEEDFNSCDVIQAPLNILDRSMLNPETKKMLSRGAVPFHARSVFLQGLLLINPKQHPQYFQPWRTLFEEINSYSKQLKIPLLELCLSFVMNIPEVSKTVIGVAETSQLKEILAMKNKSIFKLPSELSSTDEKLIHPFNWVTK